MANPPDGFRPRPLVAKILRRVFPMVFPCQGLRRWLGKTIGIPAPIVFFLVIALCSSLQCNNSGGSASQNALFTDYSGLSGKELSFKYCQSCHLYPDPSLLDKATWEKNVLVKMGHYMGIYGDTLRSDLIEGGPAGELVKAADIFPEKPLIGKSDWAKIVDYYVTQAPYYLQLQAAGPTEFAGLTNFTAIVPDFRTDPPMTTLVNIGKTGERIYVGDAKGDISSLTILDNQFKIINTIYLPAPPSGLHFLGDSLCLTMMGRVWPTDNTSGQLVKAFRPPGGTKYQYFKRMIGQLQRPVHTVFEDLTGNGRTDVIVCEYGNHTGSLSWYENKDSGYHKRVLLDQPGAIKAYAEDMNNDGKKDIVALMAQGDEAIWIFYNRGDGRFDAERVLRFVPSYGSVHFELVDFNGDGFPDILYCNGDNGDYYPVLKKYHGIRIFENNGANRFNEVFFFPMDGVYKASAADFDQDGDLDIFAIAFYPDFSLDRPVSIVYLENTERYKYTPKSLNENIPGRWITFDIGDIDSDRDLDILLGSYTGFTTFSDSTGYSDEKLRAGQSLLLLRNRLY